MSNPLADIRMLLREERDLFGEQVLAERSQPQEAYALVPRKPDAASEPMLFDLPKVTPQITTEAWGGAGSLAELESQTNTCMKCPLGATRGNFVFGVGSPTATLMLIGEAPGQDEAFRSRPSLSFGIRS